MKIEYENPFEDQIVRYENIVSQSIQSIAGVVNPDIVIDFPEGIPAFEDTKHYVFLCSDDVKPFCYLKSLDVQQLGFVCIDPFLVCPGFSVNLSSKEVVRLGLRDPSEALVLSFVTVVEDPTKTTANLLAPIIINIRELKGYQVILDEYPVQYNIWEAVSRSGDAQQEDASC